MLILMDSGEYTPSPIASYFRRFASSTRNPQRRKEKPMDNDMTGFIHTAS